MTYSNSSPRKTNFYRSGSRLIGSVAITSFITAMICSSAQAGDGAEEDIFASFGDENFVSIATGKKQTLKSAPAIASVITAEDIRAMGARDIDEVLETVPGLHVSKAAIGYNPIYVIRGIHSEFNPQVLMLVNGIPITGLLFGNRTQVWGGFPLESVSRIEVIRGPGSAIYGADAYAGTINIITKNAGGENSVNTGVLYGSYDEKRGWINAQHSLESGYEIFASIEYLNTNGPDETIERDGQTALDELLMTSASLAPGPAELRREAWDARFELKKNLLTLRMGYQERNNIGTGAGTVQVLDPVGEGNARRFNSDLTYRNPSFTKHWDIQAQISYLDMETLSDIYLAPPGAYANMFPDGVFANPDIYEKHWRTEVSGFYSGFSNHEIRIAAGYQNLDQYKIEETKNFEILSPVVPPIPLGSVVDVTDTTPFNQEEIREIRYIFLQDEWDIAPDWSLTAGLRYDNYSDFGDTVNPRLAVVWQTSYTLTSKLLYGRAFRAPSFAELFNINNPLAVGNPDLEPEVIDTWELAFHYAPNTRSSLGLNIFYYEMEDIIRFNPSVAENTGNQCGHGVEVEASWKPFDNFQITGNYAWQSSENEDNDAEAPHAPEHQLYLRGDWEFALGWFANVQVNRVMDRNRAIDDDRYPIEDYTQVDFYIRATQVIPSWEFSVGVKNLTDEEIYEPTLYDPVLLIPGDLPLAGRNYFAEIRKSF